MTHGRTIRIYGYRIYQHMSADVAVQGISQDWVTLFLLFNTVMVVFLWLGVIVTPLPVERSTRKDCTITPP